MPFDWLFSSARVVLDCLEDDFRSFLDADQYFEVARVHDAVGLPPGAAPRERVLVGHKKYSAWTGGVGRGVIFNHHNPLTEEGYSHYVRAVARFREVLAAPGRKLYTFLNLNAPLWEPADLSALFRAHSCSFH